jgi:DNA-directed RNA polymerase specialized sigma24 family protein
VRPLSDLGTDDLARALSSESSPELAAQAVEECERLLGLLDDDTLRKVALRKFEGHTNAEIARELGYVEATVERKLQRIRGIWTRELEA